MTSPEPLNSVSAPPLAAAQLLHLSDVTNVNQALELAGLQAEQMKGGQLKNEARSGLVRSVNNASSLCFPFLINECCQGVA